MTILTHRGLDPDRQPFFKESSREAFEDQLARGFSIECDPRWTRDGGIVLSHDPTLARFTDGECEDLIATLASEEVTAIESGGSHLITLQTLLQRFAEYPETGPHAIHVKRSNQDVEHLRSLLETIEPYDPSNFFLFDLAPDAARYIHARRPELRLGGSVAHPFDIARFNSVVGGTLLTLDDFLSYEGLYAWAWLDEWDRKDAEGSKMLYTAATFAPLREAGTRIALISPELHATSPALLGGESHEDARNRETLLARIKEILALNPDAICTDHPDAVRTLTAPGS